MHGPLSIHRRLAKKPYSRPATGVVALWHALLCKAGAHDDLYGFDGTRSSSYMVAVCRRCMRLREL